MVGECKPIVRPGNTREPRETHNESGDTVPKPEQSAIAPRTNPVLDKILKELSISRTPFIEPLINSLEVFSQGLDFCKAFSIKDFYCTNTNNEFLKKAGLLFREDGLNQMIQKSHIKDDSTLDSSKALLHIVDFSEFSKHLNVLQDTCNKLSDWDSGLLDNLNQNNGQSIEEFGNLLLLNLEQLQTTLEQLNKFKKSVQCLSNNDKEMLIYNPFKAYLQDKDIGYALLALKPNNLSINSKEHLYYTLLSNEDYNSVENITDPKKLIDKLIFSYTKKINELKELINNRCFPVLSDLRDTADSDLIPEKVNSNGHLDAEVTKAGVYDIVERAFINFGQNNLKKFVSTLVHLLEKKSSLTRENLTKLFAKLQNLQTKLIEKIDNPDFITTESHFKKLIVMDAALAKIWDAICRKGFISSKTGRIINPFNIGRKKADLAAINNVTFN